MTRFIIIFLLVGLFVGLSNISLAKQAEKKRLELLGPVKKVVWVEQMAGDNTPRKSAVYNFNDHGLLLKQQEIDLIRNRVFETTFDGMERECTYWSSIASAHIFIYNDAEKTYRVIYLDSDASYKEKGILDNRGNIIQRETILGTQNKPKLYTYEYDEAGKLIRARISDENGNLALAMTMQYNHREHVVKEIYPSKAGDVIIVYEYDHKGLLTKVTDNLTVGAKTTVFNYQEIDAYGNWISRTCG